MAVRAECESEWLGGWVSSRVVGLSCRFARSTLSGLHPIWPVSVSPVCLQQQQHQRGRYDSSLNTLSTPSPSSPLATLVSSSTSTISCIVSCALSSLSGVRLYVPGSNRPRISPFSHLDPSIVSASLLFRLRRSPSASVQSRAPHRHRESSAPNPQSLLCSNPRTVSHLQMRAQSIGNIERQQAAISETCIHIRIDTMVSGARGHLEEQFALASACKDARSRPKFAAGSIVWILYWLIMDVQTKSAARC